MLTSPVPSRELQRRNPILQLLLRSSPQATGIHPLERNHHELQTELTSLDLLHIDSEAASKADFKSALEIWPGNEGRTTREEEKVEVGVSVTVDICVGDSGRAEVSPFRQSFELWGAFHLFERPVRLGEWDRLL